MGPLLKHELIDTVRIQDVEHIKRQVHDHSGVLLTGKKACGVLTLPARPSHLQNQDRLGREDTVVEELQKLVGSINELELSFQSMERPEGLTDIPVSAMIQVGRWCCFVHSPSSRSHFSFISICFVFLLLLPVFSLFVFYLLEWVGRRLCSIDWADVCACRAMHLESTSWKMRRLPVPCQISATFQQVGNL